jgi:hypothetical protein
MGMWGPLCQVKCVWLCEEIGARYHGIAGGSVFLWYTRRSMYEVLDKLVAILQEIRQEQRETRKAVDSLAAKRE